MADDRLDEVGCGAVAAHVSSPYLQPPPAITVVKKRREPMKVRGRAMGWKWNPKRVTRPGKQDAMQQRCKKAARFGKAQTCVLLSEGQSHYFCLSRVRSSVSEMGKASQTGGRYLGGNRGDQVGAKTIAGEWQIRIGFQVWRKWYLILSAISLCSSISPPHTLDRKLQILPVDERGNSRWETRRQR